MGPWEASAFKEVVKAAEPGKRTETWGFGKIKGENFVEGKKKKKPGEKFEEMGHSSQRNRLS